MHRLCTLFALIILYVLNVTLFNDFYFACFQKTLLLLHSQTKRLYQIGALSVFQLFAALQMHLKHAVAQNTLFAVVQFST